MLTTHNSKQISAKPPEEMHGLLSYNGLVPSAQTSFINSRLFLSKRSERRPELFNQDN